jgi:hypothetical protein
MRATCVANVARDVLAAGRLGRHHAAMHGMALTVKCSSGLNAPWFTRPASYSSINTLCLRDDKIQIINRRQGAV